MSSDSPVIFESRGDGREVAKLGALDIGEIAPASANAGGLVMWNLSLQPYAPVGWSRPCSVDAARRELRRRIEDWLDAAHLAPVSRPPEGEIRAYRDWDQIKQAVRT